MGLIDVLTQYDTKKKAAHAAKTVKHGVSSTREEGKAVEGCCQLLSTVEIHSAVPAFDVCFHVMS